MYLQINQKYIVYTLTVDKIITKEVVFFYKKKTQIFFCLTQMYCQKTAVHSVTSSTRSSDI